MRHVGKIVLLLLTAWPLCYMVGCLGGSLLVFLAMARGEESHPDFAFTPCHLGTVLLILSLMLFYCFHALRNRTLQRIERLFWTGLIFTGNIFIMPIYWYLYIWTEQ